MNIHEFQAKDLLRKYGAQVTKGMVTTTAQEARAAAEKLGGHQWVIKAQVFAGGRGKAGGVKFADSIEKVYSLSNEMFGKRLITAQTGSEGILIRKLYIQKSEEIQREYYLGIILDRSRGMPVIMASIEGGKSIEEVAREASDKILKVYIDPVTRLKGYHIRNISDGLRLEEHLIPGFRRIVRVLYACYETTDANLIEINPLALNKDNQFIILDAKLSFDDNALYRHSEIENLRDLEAEEKAELEAGRYNLNYVKLKGNVGCIVNGAGLAMSTMDIIKQQGGEPANFLDVGGTANAESVARGLEIILWDKQVKSVLVNIFGGIVRCDRIAEGILRALSSKEINLPLIVRLEGTNSDQGIKLLRRASIKNLITAENLSEAAQKAVLAAKELDR